MIQVGINGYGTIGKRVADAVRAQPDMEVTGVVKTRPNFEAVTAAQRSYPLYTIDQERVGSFESAGLPCVGTVPELVAKSDVIVDATPGGVGETYLPLYEEHGTPAVFQGKENHEIVDASFNARANFEEAVGASYVRVVSCNTTGLSRLVAPLEEAVGIEKVRATLVRRGGDPDQTGRGPINDILPDPVTLPSHHGPDVNTIFPDLAIDTVGLTVPATLMHVHSVNVTLAAETSAREIRSLLEDESRLFLVDESMAIDGSGKLKAYAHDVGRPRGDIWENCVWRESISVEGRDLYLFQAIHQESDVIPENVDAIRALVANTNARESMATTDESLGIGLPHRVRPPVEPPTAD